MLPNVTQPVKKGPVISQTLWSVLSVVYLHCSSSITDHSHGCIQMLWPAGTQKTCDMVPGLLFLSFFLSFVFSFIYSFFHSFSGSFFFYCFSSVISICSCGFISPFQRKNVLEMCPGQRHHLYFLPNVRRTTYTIQETSK